MKLLEDMLKIKCEKEDTEILLAQWKYDKELYKDILQNTKDYYCHYTDHGIKHSETILSNVVRILGEDKIEELSSLDIWLLLESAYIHDSGMFITREEAEELCKNEQFINYFRCLELDMTDDLFEYTKFYEVKDGKLTIKEGEYNSKIEYGLKFLIGDYNRKNHAKRSRIIINRFNQLKKENILIPQRINDIPFIISEAHSYNFDDVMNIQYSESGLKLEKGHPRFIACMLRLGDLLDIDNNRFSPILMDNIGEIIPENSKNHLQKHKSINHFVIDNEVIEIVAKVEGCEENTYDIVNEIGEWFDTITDEHKNQVLNWEQIRPVSFTGKLPMIDKLIIEANEYEFINNRSKPKFSVDTNNILKLLKGSEIYKKRETAIRELLQNSIDAIFLKVYIKKREEILEDEKLDLDYNKLKEKYLKNEKIDIILEKVEDGIYCFTIRDTGIGIDKDDLKYIITGGSSPNNFEKKILIKEMPFWLKPSGNFGIGFQSIFMLADKVKIKSRKDKLEEPIEVEIYSPSYTGKKRGSVFIKKIKFNEYKRTGTEISFQFKVNANTKKININMLYKKTTLERNSILEEIESVAKNAPIKINLKELGKENRSLTDNKFKENSIFIKELGLEVLEVTRKKAIGLSSKYLFKNQSIYGRFETDFLVYKINFLADEAFDFLELNRESVKFGISRSENYKNRIICAIFKYIYVKYNEKFDEIDDPLFKLELSLFLYSYQENYKVYSLENNIKINPDIINYCINTEEIKKMEKEKLVIIDLAQRDKKINILQDTLYEKIVNIDEFIINYLIEKNSYKLIFKGNKNEIESITLMKVNSRKEETIIEDGFEKKVMLYTDYDIIEENMKYLKLDKNKVIDFLVKKEGLDSEISDKLKKYNIVRTEFTSSLGLDEFFERNMCLIPLVRNEKNKYIYNNDVKEKYVEICYQNNYFEDVTKEKIEEHLEYYIKKLKKDLFFIDEREIKENKEIEINKYEEMKKIILEMTVEERESIKELLETK